MIRKYQDIQSISIHDRVFKLRQYADDTVIFLDGFETSLRETLNILNQFITFPD